LTDSADAATGSSAPGHYGPAPAGVTLGETVLALAWNVQGDATRSPFANEAPRLFEIALPGSPNTTARRGALTALWLTATSWLLVSGSPSALTDFAAKRDALKAASGALFDVTASCAGWTISGPRAEAVLASASPLEFSARAFRERSCAQSTFADIGTLFYRPGGSAFTLIVAKSHARAVWRALCAAALPYGYDVLPAKGF
jgi:heterotetrameric sarcosine oxidase gamma subunit